MYFLPLLEHVYISVYFSNSIWSKEKQQKDYQPLLLRETLNIPLDFVSRQHTLDTLIWFSVKYWKF